jgi:hypothetical protein
MEECDSPEGISFFGRIAMALRLVFSPDFAKRACDALRESEAKSPAAQVEISAEKKQAAGLLLLQMLQREGRLVDFLQQDITAFADEEVGTAARVVHTGCRKLLRECFELVPSMQEAEGTQVTVPAGFNQQRVRLTGSVAGQPPFRGTLKHHGWVATTVRMPAVSESVDARVIAPAEVELD